MTYGNEANVIEAQQGGINVRYVGQPVVTPGWTGNVGAWNEGYAIMAQSEHPEEAWAFLKWLGTDGALLRGGAAVAGEAGEANISPPTYRPLAAEWAGDDPFRLEVLAMQEHVMPPVFSPDIWTSVDPFYEAWRQMTEEGASVEEAVAFAAEECQLITDDLWDTWEYLSG
jgi:ABC-type glycerol-3-phosphate transport system substrate-binding protein